MREVVWVDGNRVIREYAMTCTPAQLKLTLYRMGLLDTVSEIAATNPEASILWEFATVMERNSHFISAMAANPIRPFTAEEIDAIFLAAQTA